jgi:hypothetical protein
MLTTFAIAPRRWDAIRLGSQNAHQFVDDLVLDQLLEVVEVCLAERLAKHLSHFGSQGLSLPVSCESFSTYSAPNVITPSSAATQRISPRRRSASLPAGTTRCSKLADTSHVFIFRLSVPQILSLRLRIRRRC